MRQTFKYDEYFLCFVLRFGNFYAYMQIIFSFLRDQTYIECCRLNFADLIYFKILYIQRIIYDSLL